MKLKHAAMPSVAIAIALTLSGNTADPTKFIKDTLGGAIRPGEQKPFAN